MKKISTLEIDAAFERIWEVWPNKDNPKAAEKAFEVCIKQGEDIKLVELACKIYADEYSTQEYTHRLNNFLLKEEWKDMVEGCKDIKSYGEVVESRRKEAILICETWNQKRKSFWCECLDVNERVPLVVKALKNQFFKKNWKKALDKLSEIFKIKPTENDKFRNLVISLSWFCDISPHKHTVLKIMEGQFGHPTKDSSKKIRIATKEEIKEAKQEACRLFEEVFGRKPKPLPKRKINNNSQPLKGIVDEVSKVIGLTEKSKEGGDIGIY